ncbi:hypothetical protein EV368DRAFT_76133 [Lentinula lateritia]|nr:hypothetical protein EV368DRAFT_76133 [Lentinula lateritia]
MDVECPNCHALHWTAERLTKSSATKPIFGTCCKSGKLQLPMLQNPPQELQNLFDGTDYESKHFLDNIRSYNSAFAFVHGNKIKGALWHAMGSLLPETGKTPIYAQLYIVAPETALEQHLANKAHHGTGLCQTNVKLQFKNHTDPRRYNMPAADEVAVILPGPGEAIDHRDIILQLRAGPLKRIYETNPAYQPLHYVLLFPRGELGWHPKINYVNGDASATKFVSQMEYYAYRLHQRPAIKSNHLFQAKNLFQQFIVDGWAVKIIPRRLRRFRRGVRAGVGDGAQ